APTACTSSEPGRRSRAHGSPPSHASAPCAAAYWRCRSATPPCSPSCPASTNAGCSSSCAAACPTPPSATCASAPASWADTTQPEGNPRMNEDLKPGDAAVIDQQRRAASESGDYTEEDIKVLKDADHIRQNPGMYIGDTGKNGLHHLVYELVHNCVDEALAGYCKNILVRLDVDGSCTVADDGRGIPV